MNTSITLWAGICQQLSIRDNDHRPDKKRLGELNLSLIRDILAALEVKP